MTSITDPGIERLLGSSAPTGLPPEFEPIAAAGDVVHEPALSTIDPVFAAIEMHKAAAAALGEVEGDIPPDCPEDEAERVAFVALLQASPTTTAGLKVWSQYLTSECGYFDLADDVLPAVNDAIQDLVQAAPLSPTGTGSDAELLALGAEFERVLAQATEAYAERYRLEAERDNSLPAIPDGLIADPDHRLGEDVEYFTAYVPGDTDGSGRRYYTAKAVDRIQRVPRTKYVFDRWQDEGNSYERVMKRVADDDAQARAVAVVVAFEPWDEACRRLSAAIGYDAAVARHDDLELRSRAIFDRVEMLTPLTIAGLAVQARTMVTYSRGSLMRFTIIKRLEEFARAAVPPQVDAEDPFVAAFREANAARRRVNDFSLNTAESDAAVDELQRVCDAVVDGTVPVSAAGAVAALDWAIAEFEEFHSDEDGTRDKGGQFMLALLQGALTMARQHAISTAMPAGTIDLTPTLLADRRQAIAAVDDGRYATEAEALMDHWGSCDTAVMGRPASTLAGARASIEWARDELLRFGFRPTDPDGGNPLVLSLLNAAIGVLRPVAVVTEAIDPNRQAA